MRETKPSITIVLVVSRWKAGKESLNCVKNVRNTRHRFLAAGMAWKVDSWKKTWNMGDSRGYKLWTDSESATLDSRTKHYSIIFGLNSAEVLLSCKLDWTTFGRACDIDVGLLSAATRTLWNDAAYLVMCIFLECVLTRLHFQCPCVQISICFFSNDTHLQLSRFFLLSIFICHVVFQVITFSHSWFPSFGWYFNTAFIFIMCK